MNAEFQAALCIEFADKWGLDESARARLIELPPQALQITLTQFSPKAETRNVNALFFSFLKSIPNRSLEGPASTIPESWSSGNLSNATKGGPTEEEIQQFQESWAIDESAMTIVTALPPKVQAHVIATFNPPLDTANISGKLVKFAKGALETPQGQQAQMEMHQMQSGMGKGMGKGMGGGTWLGTKGGMVNPAVANKAKGMGVNNTNNIGMGDMGKGMGQGMFNPNVKGKGKGMMGSMGQGRMDQITLFCQNWGLDTGCQGMLRQAPVAVQQLTMQTFSPKPNTTNVNALFISFFKKQFENLGMPVPSNASRCMMILEHLLEVVT